MRQGRRWLAAAVTLGIVGDGCRDTLKEHAAGLRNIDNLREIGAALKEYRREHGRWPDYLTAALTKRSACSDTLWYLGHPSIPPIAGASPLSSYHYARPGPSARAEDIIVYPNLRDEPHLLHVLRFDGTLALLTSEQYERELRLLGEDYDALPGRWGPYPILMVALLFLLLLAGLVAARHIALRRREL